MYWALVGHCLTATAQYRGSSSADISAFTCRLTGPLASTSNLSSSLSASDNLLRVPRAPDDIQDSRTDSCMIRVGRLPYCRCVRDRQHCNLPVSCCRFVLALSKGCRAGCEGTSQCRQLGAEAICRGEEIRAESHAHLSWREYRLRSSFLRGPA